MVHVGYFIFAVLGFLTVVGLILWFSNQVKLGRIELALRSKSKEGKIDRTAWDLLNELDGTMLNLRDLAAICLVLNILHWKIDKDAWDPLFVEAELFDKEIHVRWDPKKERFYPGKPQDPGKEHDA